MLAFTLEGIRNYPHTMRYFLLWSSRFRRSNIVDSILLILTSFQMRSGLDLVGLVLLDLLPKLGVLLDADLLRLLVDELVQAAEVHGLVEQRDDVLVKSLPVRVLQMILLAL